MPLRGMMEDVRLWNTSACEMDERKWFAYDQSICKWLRPEPEKEKPKTSFNLFET